MEYRLKLMCRRQPIDREKRTKIRDDQPIAAERFMHIVLDQHFAAKLQNHS